VACRITGTQSVTNKVLQGSRLEALPFVVPQTERYKITCKNGGEILKMIQKWRCHLLLHEFLLPTHGALVRPWADPGDYPR